MNANNYNSPYFESLRQLLEMLLLELCSSEVENLILCGLAWTSCSLFVQCYFIEFPATYDSNISNKIFSFMQTLIV